MDLLKQIGKSLLPVLFLLPAAVFWPQPAHSAETGEVFCTPAYREANVDSCAVWHSPKNRSLLLATGKESHQLLVFDGRTGELIRKFGEAGGGPGQFRRPNGIFVTGDLVFVVERDNQRCQVLGMPGFEPLGTFGEGLLKKPYGIYVCRASGEAGHQVYITDDFDPEEKGAPPLSERGKRFAVNPTAQKGGAGTSIAARLTGYFGEAEGPGVIRTTESIWGDPANDRLLLADEAEKSVKVYRLSDLQFTGTVIGKGRFQADPEGISLFPAGAPAAGFWILTDQREADLTRFHLFDRRSLSYVDTFTGRKTVNTDGIWLDTAAPEGEALLYAVHDDQSVCALSFEALIKGMGLLQ
jgi:3-phytase